MNRPVLLFDYGETLVQYMRHGQFRTILRQSIARAETAVRDLGYPVPAAREIRRRVDAENYEAKNSRVRPLSMRLARIFGLPRARLSQDEWFAICQAFMQPLFAASKIYADTHPALDHFKARGHRIGILSNSPWGAPSGPWADELARYGMWERCEKVIFCSEVGWRKPARPIFRRALEHFQCPPEQCLFIGDNPRWDVLGARRAGMVPVFIDRTGGQAVAGARTINALMDLEDVLAELK